MQFTEQILAELALPDGKTEAIFFDDTLPGFGVRLRQGVRRVWIVQYRIAGRTRRESLGDIRKIGLEAARKVAKRRVAEVTLGQHPPALRDKLTLEVLAERYLAFKEPKLRSNAFKADKHHLSTHWKSLHRLPLHSIKRHDVADGLGEITDKHGAIAASRARGTLGSFFGWAMREGLVDENPVVGTNAPARGARSRYWVNSNDDFGRSGSARLSSDLSSPYLAAAISVRDPD